MISPEYGAEVRDQGGRESTYPARAIIVPRSETYRAINGRNTHLVDLSATVCAAAGIPYEDLPGQSLLAYR